MSVVVFNYQQWSGVYPEFATTVSSDQASFLFTNKTPPFLDNTDYSPVTDIPTRTGLMYDLVAHLAQLQYGSSLQAAGPLVGRIASATEGSVSVSTSMDGVPGEAAWYMQTKYGANFWAATATYRSALWIGPVCDTSDTFFPASYDANFYGL
jgi:hypothetical protein